jgi:hypothetical protein
MYVMTTKTGVADKLAPVQFWNQGRDNNRDMAAALPVLLYHTDRPTLVVRLLRPTKRTPCRRRLPSDGDAGIRFDTAPTVQATDERLESAPKLDVADDIFNRCVDGSA